MNVKPISEMSPIEMISEIEFHRKRMPNVTMLMSQNLFMRQSLAHIGFFVRFEPDLPNDVIEEFLKDTQGDENDSNPNL